MCFDTNVLIFNCRLEKKRKEVPVKVKLTKKQQALDEAERIRLLSSFDNVWGAKNHSGIVLRYALTKDIPILNLYVNSERWDSD
jgi:hypothetical protein